MRARVSNSGYDCQLGVVVGLGYIASCASAWGGGVIGIRCQE